MDKFDKVKQIIVDELDVAPEKVVREASLIGDLGADSLSVIEMVMSFEDEFDTQIPDEELEKIKTVGDIVDALDKL
ncbi:MAG: acyl carrier protein [Eubacteriaceae bacterium]|jgi:acyl carrier protein